MQLTYLENLNSSPNTVVDSFPRFRFCNCSAWYFWRWMDKSVSFTKGEWVFFWPTPKTISPHRFPLWCNYYFFFDLVVKNTSVIEYLWITSCALGFWSLFISGWCLSKTMTKFKLLFIAQLCLCFQFVSFEGWKSNSFFQNILVSLSKCLQSPICSR